MASKIKLRIYELVEKGSFGKKHNLLFDYFIATLIILNVIAIAVATVATLSQVLSQALIIFEIVSVIIFTIEYLMRIYVADLSFPRKSKLASIIAFIISPYGLIDLFAILPFYVPFLIPFDLRFLRLFRLLRFVILLKLTRYNKALKLISSVFREKKTELGMTFFLVAIILIVASFLMYFIEGKAQPDAFNNVFSSLWWALATLTTIGYGDIYPLTTLGKIISGIIAVLGIGVIALPTGILSAGFAEKIRDSKTGRQTTVCPHCGKEI
jgi:voltage-gated potassium channel